MRTVWLSIAFIVVAFHVSAKETPVFPQYKYTVSWDEWPSVDLAEWKKLGIYVNGERIGSPPEAFEYLATLPLTKGEHVKVILTLPQKGAKPVPQPYVRSHFVQTWYAKGIMVDLFEGGRRLNCHSITWTNFAKNGNFVREMDDATWLLDGQPIGDGKAIVEKLKVLSKEPGLVIQYIQPLGWLPLGPTKPATVEALLDELVDAGQVRAIYITPDRDISEKYLEEVLVPQAKRQEKRNDK